MTTFSQLMTAYQSTDEYHAYMDGYREIERIDLYYQKALEDAFGKAAVDARYDYSRNRSNSTLAYFYDARQAQQKRNEELLTNLRNTPEHKAYFGW